MKVKQVNGYTIELNRSRESMMQNEAAFPGEAVNTIAVRMYFPEADAQAVCAAVDRVIERTELFRLRLAQQAGGYVLRDAGACGPLCACKTPRSRAGAEAFCRRKEETPFEGFPEGALYGAWAVPVTERRISPFSSQASA